MAVRDVIRIDETLCDGCGLCIEACAEGAIVLVDGKARLRDESHCDGLGACLGGCPQGAITVERAEAAPFAAPAVADPAHRGTACPGSRPMSFVASVPPGQDVASRPPALRHWPVQLHLVAPAAPYFQGADVLLAADCVAYAIGDFHRDHLVGRSLAIACPKLDSHQEVYLEKLVAMIDEARIASLTVMVMEVPCCGGLLRLAASACARARRQVPIRALVVGIRGEIVRDGPVGTQARRSPLSTLASARAGGAALECSESDRS